MPIRVFLLLELIVSAVKGVLMKYFLAVVTIFIPTNTNKTY